MTETVTSQSSWRCSSGTFLTHSFNPLNVSVILMQKLTGSYMRTTLEFNGLIILRHFENILLITFSPTINICDCGAFS